MESDKSVDKGVAIDLLSENRRPKILICLWQAKTIRFHNFIRMLPGISNNLLSQCLKEFEKDKIVERKQYEEISPRAGYALAEPGYVLHPAVHYLNEWERKYRLEIVPDSDE